MNQLQAYSDYTTQVDYKKEFHTCLFVFLIEYRILVTKK